MLATSVSAMVAWMHRRHDQRLDEQEKRINLLSAMMAGADQHRTAMREELRDFRSEINHRVETLRVESNASLRDISRQLSGWRQ